MNLNEIKDLMAQFDQSSLKEFSYKNGTDELVFSKNEAKLVAETSPAPQPVVPAAVPTVAPQAQTTPAVEAVSESNTTESVAEGDLVESPLVGVAYLAHCTGETSPEGALPSSQSRTVASSCQTDDHEYSCSACG